MALPSFSKQIVKIWRAPYIIERGTRVRDWNEAVFHIISGCDIQPTRSSTNWHDSSQAVTVRLTLRLPPESDIVIGDCVEVDGVKYALEGAPHKWESPSGRVSHIECALVDWLE